MTNNIETTCFVNNNIKKCTNNKKDSSLKLNLAEVLLTTSIKVAYKPVYPLQITRIPVAPHH